MQPPVITIIGNIFGKKEKEILKFTKIFRGIPQELHHRWAHYHRQPLFPME
jgi:hypothetical protein